MKKTSRFLFTIIASAAISSAAAAAGNAPPGYRVVGCDTGTCRLEKIGSTRDIGSTFKSPTFEAGDPFKRQAKTPGAPADCPDGKCGLRSKSSAAAPKGVEFTGCKDGTCAKPSSLAKAPPSPGVAAAKGGCSTGTCSSGGASAKAGGAAAKSGGCSNGKGGGKGGPLGFLGRIFKAIGRVFGLA
jgi:hypothetical protein